MSEAARGAGPNLLFLLCLDRPKGRSYTSASLPAGVAELADAQDSGSCEGYPSCGFKSHLRQNRIDALSIRFPFGDAAVCSLLYPQYPAQMARPTNRA